MRKDDFLIHYGVTGQEWGKRRYQNYDGTLTEEGKIHYGYYDRKDGTKDYKRLQKDAENDAREYARAKAYYGEGAGTRRKKIKNIISERMKDPDYKKEFERILSGQNMTEHQQAANRERKFNDAKNTTIRTARGVKNFLLEKAVPMTLSAVAIGSLLKYTGAGAKIASLGKTTLASAGRWLRRGGRAAASGAGNYANAFAAFMGRG